MLILGIETSGERACACIIKDNKVLVNIECSLGLTHSETLLPTIKKCFDITGKYTVKDLDLIAVSAGPGSFTGLRIGMATAKGLAMPYNIKISAVSTLEALSYNVSDSDRVIIPIMDARCDRVYFNIHNYFSDSCCEIETLINTLNKFPNIKIIFVGDGIDSYKDYIIKNLKINYKFANLNNRYQKALSVALLGLKNNNSDINYLLKPQAEREKN